VKSTEQQDLQALHRIREHLVVQRTSLINHTRGLLAEYGAVLPKGAWRFRGQAPAAVDEADLSPFARELFAQLLDQLRDVDERLGKLQELAPCLRSGKGNDADGPRAAVHQMDDQSQGGQQRAVF
jgi:transposase